MSTSPNCAPRTAEDKLHLFIAIDRTSKFAFARLVERATTKGAAAFLDDLVAAVPCQVHTVLTDNGIEFTDLAMASSLPILLGAAKIQN